MGHTYTKKIYFANQNSKLTGHPVFLLAKSGNHVWVAIQAMSLNFVELDKSHETFTGFVSDEENLAGGVLSLVPLFSLTVDML